MIIFHFLFVQVIHPLYFRRIISDTIPTCDASNPMQCVSNNSTDPTENIEVVYPFLPLLLYSCMGAIQLIVVWIQMLLLICLY